jgi:N12 class adenine-specific DNA methylase
MPQLPPIGAEVPSSFGLPPLPPIGGEVPEAAPVRVFAPVSRGPLVLGTTVSGGPPTLMQAVTSGQFSSAELDAIARSPATQATQTPDYRPPPAPPPPSLPSTPIRKRGRFTGLPGEDPVMSEVPEPLTEGLIDIGKGLAGLGRAAVTDMQGRPPSPELHGRFTGLVPKATPVSDEVLADATKVLSGLAKVSTPFVVAGLATVPLHTAATLGLTILADKSGQKLVELAGGTPDEQAFAGALTGFVVASGGAGLAYEKLQGVAVETVRVAKKAGQTLTLAGKLSGYAIGDVPGYRAQPSVVEQAARPSEGRPLPGQVKVGEEMLPARTPEEIATVEAKVAEGRVPRPKAPVDVAPAELPPIGAEVPAPEAAPVEKPATPPSGVRAKPVTPQIEAPTKYVLAPFATAQYAKPTSAPSVPATEGPTSPPSAAAAPSPTVPAPVPVTPPPEKPAEAPTPEGEKWKAVGLNDVGATLYEDKNGVRSLVMPSGARITEPVKLVPTRSGMKFEVGPRSPRWTVQEGEAPPAEVPEVPALPEGKIETRAPETPSPRPPDTGTLAGAPPEDVGGAAAPGEIRGGGVPSAGTDTERGGRSSGERPTVPRRDVEPESGVGVPTGGEGRTEPAAEPTAPRVTQARPAADGRLDYRITPEDNLGQAGDAAKIDANLAAIRILKQLQTEGRRATAEEQRQLVQYTGWGAHSERMFASRIGAGQDKRATELKTLLSEKEYAAAQASTKNAHFTAPAVVQAIWAGVQRLGFKGGRALEPSAGIGHFLGLQPAELAARTKWSATELDPTTAAIAQHLYQTAHVEPTGLESAKLPENFYDLAISNVPFGAYPVHDPKFAKRPAALTKQIHNYFFAKGLDLVRPGGIIAFVTADGTLDATNPILREHLAQHGELLGAIRLPKTAFAKTAGTEVVTDIIFLQKRATPISAAEATKLPWVHTGTITLKDEHGQTRLPAIPINQYFLDHPSMVVGTHALSGSMYRGGEYTVEPPVGGAPIEIEIVKRLLDLPENVYTAHKPETGAKHLTPRQAVPAPDEVKRDAYTIREKNEIWQRQDTELVRVDAGMAPPAKARLIGLIRVRDALHDTMRAMLEDKPDTEIKATQKTLNKLYDAFVARQGYLSTRVNVTAIADDPDAGRLAALEFYDPIAKTATKAAIFTRRTLQPPKPITHVDDPTSALLVALNETGRLDWERVAELTGQPRATLEDALGGTVVFKTPSGEWVTADEYLSGDVKTKLEQAEAAARLEPAFKVNVTALQKVIPEDIPPSKIDPRLGAGWVPVETAQEFIGHLLGVGKRSVRVTYVAPLAQWTVQANDNVRMLTANTETWGTPRRGANALDIIDDTMNLRTVTVYDTIKNADGSESRVVNQDDTQAAREKQNAIKEEFTRWLWDEPARRDRMLRAYNDTQNRTRRRTYDGSHLDFPGMAIMFPDKAREDQLRQHQKDGVWRSLQTPNMLAAHVVGAGKTYLVIGSAMERRRLGLARKPVVAVPNHLVKQWARDFSFMYPTASVLSVSKKDFEKANRKRFMARIATGDWDAVVIPHSVFTRIPLKPETWEAFYDDQIKVLEQFIEDLTAAEGKKSRTVKQLEAMKKRLEVKLKRRQAKVAERTDDVVFWEELGIDALYVDEAHLFKNLWFPTKMTRISGLPNSESDRAFDMLLKVRHTQKLNTGGGVFFATGTPVSNTMAEMYTMQRYLQPEVLEDRGLAHFDAWAQMFGDTMTTMEVSPEGKGFRMKTSFSRFSNMGRLSEMFRTFADVKTAEELKLPVPKLKGGEAQAVTVKASPALVAYVEDLTKRAEAIRSGKVKDPRKDNMLKITSEGRKGALDMRLLDFAYGDDPNSKLNKAVDEIYKTWAAWKAHKGTQLVFSDLGTPKKVTAAGAPEEEADETEKDAQAEIRALNASNFDLYNDVKRKLVAKGIPAEEIAFIHDANTDARKETLFDNVNTGKVRILMGSTEKMGAGMNVQRLLVRLHQLDAPWRPSDVEQRTGRILRQGNYLAKLLGDTFEVEITNYITSGSFDAYIWQTLERKARMIAQGLSGLEDGESLEDVGGGALNPAEMKAAASGNPMVLEKVKADAELRKLESQKRVAQDKAYRLVSRQRSLPGAIKGHQETIASAKAFIAKTAKPEPFTIRLINKVDGKKFTAYDDRGEASSHLAKLADEARTIALQEGRDKVRAPIGSYAGHDLIAAHDGVAWKDYQGQIQTAPGEGLNTGTAISMVSHPKALEGWLPSLDYAIFQHPASTVTQSETAIPRIEKELADVTKELETHAFPHDARMEQLRADIERIDKALDLDAKSQAAAAPVVSEEDEEEEGGVTLQSTILPGAAEFVALMTPIAKAAATKAAPAFRVLGEEVGRFRQQLLGAFAPDTVTPQAVSAAGIISEGFAARDRGVEQARRLLRDIEKEMDAWPRELSMAFWDVMEGLADPSTLDPAIRPIAALFRQMLDTHRAAILKRGLISNYIEHYWGHEWVRGGGTVEQAMRSVFGKRPLQGRESFRKRRTIPTMREGLALGLQPVSWNPATQLGRKLLEMKKSIAWHDIKKGLKEQGLIKFVPGTKRGGEGWVRLPESIGLVYGPPTIKTPTGESVKIPFGRLVAGHYWAPAEVARLLDNAMSSGLRGKNLAFDVYRNFGNTLVGLQLSLSGYHAMMTGMEAIASKQALVFEQIVRGQFVPAMKAQAQVPIAPVLDVIRGRKIVQAFFSSDPQSAEMAAVIDRIVTAGGGFGWNLFEHTGAPEKFMRNLRSAGGGVKTGDVPRVLGQAAALAWHTVPALIELTAKPIMEHWVPYLKAAAFDDLAVMELETLGPEPDPEERRRVLRDAWKSIDNRFGQLRYDNLFWNNAQKDLGMASVRALGWNIGSVREMFGAPTAQLKQLGLTGGTGGFGKPPMRMVNVGKRGRMPLYEHRPESRLHRKAAWFLAQIITYGLAGAIFMYLMTGKGPETLKDYFFPQNGKKDRNGKPERVSIAGYFKDLYAVAHAFPGSAVEAVQHKLHPLMTMIYDIVSNEDFFGREIRNMDDPLVERVADIMRYVLREAQPITVEQRDPWSFFGITKAPATVTRSPFESYLHDIAPPVHVTKEQGTRADERRELREAVRGGLPPSALPEHLSPAAKRATIRGAQRPTYLYGFQRASMGQALKAYGLATPEERGDVRAALIKKWPSAVQSTPPAERAALLERYRAALALSWTPPKRAAGF